MSIGMLLHKFAPPRPPKPSFSRTIQSTISTKPGEFVLHFYVPKDYEVERQLGFKNRRKSLAVNPDLEEGKAGRPVIMGEGVGVKKAEGAAPKSRSKGGYPVLINFHGGGFTLGTATDDARWCGTVVTECEAVVVSVEYRLAPECPFPTAVEDGVDAVLWVAEHAEELGIDSDKIALSGFSSGANMAFTVPIRLYDHLTGFSRATTRDGIDSAQGSTANLHGRVEEGTATESGPSSSSSTTASASAFSMPLKPTATASVETQLNVSICAIVPWYPPTDYTQTREQRRSTCVRADQELPSLFTDLFDESYLHPPDSIPLSSPYLSPGIASTELLRAALPQNIFMFTCEWDMLLAEGIKMKERLEGEVGKSVVYRMIEGVPHGWDKAPNPIKPTPGVKEHYLFACKQLGKVWNVRSGRRQSRLVR